MSRDSGWLPISTSFSPVFSELWRIPPTLLDTTIRSEPWQLGHGEWVVAIVGKAGGVSCQALSRVTP